MCGCGCVDGSFTCGKRGTLEAKYLIVPKAARADVLKFERPSHAPPFTTQKRPSTGQPTTLQPQLNRLARTLARAWQQACHQAPSSARGNARRRKRPRPRAPRRLRRRTPRPFSGDTLRRNSRRWRAQSPHPARRARRERTPGPRQMQKQTMGKMETGQRTCGRTRKSKTTARSGAGCRRRTGAKVRQHVVTNPYPPYRKA